MEEENFFFYLPPGCFTSFELLSIIYKPPDDKQISLEIQFNNSSVSLPEPKKEGELLKWSIDSAPEFSLSRASKFSLITNEETIPVNFDDLTLISSPKNFNPEEVSNIFVFCFISGYFARKSDYQINSLRATPNLKFITTSKIETYCNLCKDYKEKLEKYQNIRNEKLKASLDNRQNYQKKSSELRVQKFEEYKAATQDTPSANLKYNVDPRSGHLENSVFSTVFQSSLNFSSPGATLTFRIPTSRSNPDLKELSTLNDISDAADQDSRHNLQRRATCSAKMFKKFKEEEKKGKKAACDQSETAKDDQFDVLLQQKFFPEERQGPRSPSQDEIRMLLSELPLIFPVDVEKRTFCNICVDDTDVNSSRMLMFNVIHFLALFSEFTGVIYNYRIGQAEGGWYKLENRITGAEVKREITSRNVMNSPLRAAVINCLKKIVYEFNLKVKDNDDMILLIDSVINFYQDLK